MDNTIIYKIKITNEEVERYLRQEEEIMVEVYDENDEVVDALKKTRKIPNPKKRKFCGKCEQTATIKKNKKENKVEKFIEEINTPNTENGMMNEQNNNGSNSIENLVESYNNLGSGNATAISKWYRLGRDFKQKVSEMKEGTDKLEQIVRKEIYDQMMDIITENIDVENIDKKRDAIKEKIRGTVRLYELFKKIGPNRMTRVKETTATIITKFTEKEREEIINKLRN
jgi:hypothetical protein